MRKFFMIVLVICVMSVNCFAEVVAETAEEEKVNPIEVLIKEVYDSSVSIFSIGMTGMGFCSGVVIKNEDEEAYILTAKHCVGPYEETYVEDVLVDVTIVSNNDDLALLITKKKIEDKVSAVLAEVNAKRGSIALHLGFPKTELYIRAGLVWLSTFDHQYIKMPVIGGCSGGGVFNLEGQLIGILWGGIGETFAVTEPISDVKKFLKSTGKIK